MEAYQLKQSLLDKLISIEDEILLEQINQLLENVDVEKSVFKVSNRQQQLLEKSENDIKNGRVISNDDINKEEETWLNGSFGLKQPEIPEEKSLNFGLNIIICNLFNKTVRINKKKSTTTCITSLCRKTN